MMTSHLCAASVLRTKPGAWGYQVYEIPLPSLSASSSASLFSNPSRLSVEKGILCGSAQTLSTLGSTTSIDDPGRSSACANNFSDTNIPAATVQTTHRLNGTEPITHFAMGLSSRRAGLHRIANASCCFGAGQHSALQPKAAVFCLGGPLGLVFMLLRSSARNGPVGAGSEIDENIVEITHDVRISCERRHDVFLRRIDVIPAVDHGVDEVKVPHRFQRIGERWSIGRPFTVRAVANMAVRVIATEA